jgi:hypothetical protein
VDLNHRPKVQQSLTLCDRNRALYPQLTSVIIPENLT